MFGSGATEGGTAPDADPNEDATSATAAGGTADPGPTSGGDPDGGESSSAAASADGSQDASAGTTGDDTGAPDTDGSSGSTDDGAPVELDNCGFPLDGPWIEFEYTQAGVSPQSPSWDYSETPGWGAAEWAASNANWPEVWDVFDNITVSDDPIGVLAVVGPSAELQLMIGLEELDGYDYATACIEGRSVSATASVVYSVYNPLNGCGVDGAMMAHDWSVHAAGFDLEQCFPAGSGVQALRIEPTGGSNAIGIQRVRLVLHDADY
jgi:hypothetical protein